MKESTEKLVSRINKTQKRIDANRKKMADEIVRGQKITTVEEGKRFARAWIITAAQESDNAAYYRSERDKLQKKLDALTKRSKEMSSKSTRTDLVKELEFLLPSCGATKAKKVRSIIDAAKRGEFHDFKSQHAMPKVILVNRLRDAALNGIASRVIDGEFDEPADAEDVAELALELKDEPALRKMLKLPDPGKS